MQNTVTLLGATGLIGSHVLRELLDDPQVEKVIVLLRRSLSLEHPKLDVQVVDFSETAKWPAFIGGSTLISCLGTTRKQVKGDNDLYRQVDYNIPLTAAKGALQNGISQMIIVSSLGADPRSRFFYPRLKGELERDLQALPLAGLHILRPSFLSGDRAVERPAEKIFGAILNGIAPLLTGKWQKYRSINADTIAKAIVTLVHADKKGKYVYESDKIHTLTTSSPEIG